MNYHVIDPSYFDDAIAQFAVEYDWWHVTGQVVDDYGYQKNTFSKLPLIGSLQPQSYRRIPNKEGVTEIKPYDFYCKSIYRIEVGDFINYKNEWLIVTAIYPYDEYGVRKADLQSVNMASYKDLTEAVKAQTGEIIP